MLDVQSNSVGLGLLHRPPAALSGDLLEVPCGGPSVVQFFLKGRAGVAEPVLLILGGCEIRLDLLNGPGRQ